MRRISFTALSLLLAATLAPQALHAAGNVLVPSDSSDSSSQPNLGLSAPPPMLSNPVPTTTGQPPIKTPQIPAVTTTQTLTQTAPPITSPAQTQIPARSPQMPARIAPFTPEELKALPPGSIPTRVVQQPDMSAALANMQSSQNPLFNLAYRL